MARSSPVVTTVLPSGEKTIELGMVRPPHFRVRLRFGEPPALGAGAASAATVTAVTNTRGKKQVPFMRHSVSCRFQRSQEGPPAEERPLTLGGQEASGS